MTVMDFYRLIDDFAPFVTQADGDNSGFLVGSGSQEITAVLFALDVTEPVIDEAVRLHAQLIVTHHPLMFSPVQTMTENDYESRLIRHLIRENISLIAAHTNLDQAPGGINDVLAACCGLSDVTGEGFFRSGFLPATVTAREYADRLKTLLHTEVRLMGPVDAPVRKIGLCSGGGSSEWLNAFNNGCDAFLSGEIRHHHALAMADCGLIAFECGHFATEEPGILALSSALQKIVNKVECKVRIYRSEISAYSFPGNRDRR